LSSSILRGSDFAVTEEGIRDTVRQVMLPLWNSWYFLSLYANAEAKTGSINYSSTNVLDVYIFSKLHKLVAEATKLMDSYDLFEACQQVRGFLDALTNWYIRRSRDRFWAGDQDAINTLHTTLHVLTRVIAPLLPLTSEKIFRGLTGERSVHLQTWPSPGEIPCNNDLVTVMDQVRDVCSSTLSLRKVHARRVRLPLAKLTVASPLAEGLRPFISIITDEVNVQEVVLSTDVAGVARHELQVIPAALGPRLGSNTQKVIVAVKKGDWKQTGETIVAGGVELQPHEFQLKLMAAVGDADSLASAALQDGQGIVLLDIQLTPALLAEGAARDVVRAVQQARREAKLLVSDRITLTLGLPEDLAQQIAPFMSYIAAETLAELTTMDPNAVRATDLDGTPIYVGVERLR
jgi:isoleucyl-tRNA synthetase